jgi:hypothetical protein
MSSLNSTKGIFDLVGVVLNGKTLKYQEFNSSGTFTPTSAAISAGGVHQIFIVGGGERGASANQGGCGGEVIETFVTLTNTNGCAVTIGAGGTSVGADGGNSTFAGSSAGGVNIVAQGGSGLNLANRQTAGAGGRYAISTPAATISPATVSIVINPARLNLDQTRAHGWQSAYAYAYRHAYQSAYAYTTAAGPGYKGYGAGGSATTSGINTPPANSGAGSSSTSNAASGYCLVTWYE